MYLFTGTARVRGCVVAAVLVAGACFQLPAFAQQCPPEARIQSMAQSVNEGVAVTPKGNSSKPNNATFLWEHVSGPGPITFSPSATAVDVSFIAPQVTGDQQVVIRLTVFGCSGLSHSTTGTVTVRDTTTPPTNTAPTAIPTATPPIADEHVAVTLSGTGSTDPQNNITQYLWTQVGGTPVTLATPNSATTTFETPSVPTAAGETLTFRLRVTDAGGLFHEANVTVNVLFANDAPHAALTCPEIVLEGDSVVLDGSASTDYEDDLAAAPLTYQWSQLLGPPNFDIASLATESVTIVPHLGTGDDGLVEFELKVFDSEGLHSTATCSVFIEDTTAPVFGNDDDRIEEATGPDGANVAYNLTATDNVEGDVSGAIACTPTSGDLFLLDVPTQVHCNVADLNGNTANTNFLVTVLDQTKPVIVPPNDIALEATGPTTVVTWLAPETDDVVDVDLVATCAPPSGTAFTVGSHEVTCTATDASGNAAVPATFDVTVHDTTPPAVTVPAEDVVVEAVSASGAPATFAASAFDLVDLALTPTCTPPSGSTFPLGTTEATCSATDTAGNTGSASFNVQVLDRTPPELTMPSDIVAEATSPAGASVTFTPTATDLVDANVDIVCTPASGSTFGLGDTTVECTATDDAGNSANGSFNVRVQDTTKPNIDTPADIVVTTTSGSQKVVTYTEPNATDLVDTDVDVDCQLPSGTTFPAGDTTVTCTATDDAGNVATSTFTISVRYPFNGFFRPIDNLPVTNMVKAGQAIPVKFSLGGNQGMAIFSPNYPRTVAIGCGSTLVDSVEETVTAGSSSLQYDAASGQYIYVWKTDKAWSGTCRQLQVKFADGTTQYANFNFTR